MFRTFRNWLSAAFKKALRSNPVETLMKHEGIRAIVPQLDPVEQLMKREDIRAAARYWRERISSARTGSAYDASFETTVRTPLTPAELDAFELAMARQFARAMHFVPDSPLFKESGVDVSFYVSCVASDADVGHKVAYPGFFTRMRILPDKEVAYEVAPFRSMNWVSIWTAPTTVSNT